MTVRLPTKIKLPANVRAPRIKRRSAGASYDQQRLTWADSGQRSTTAAPVKQTRRGRVTLKDVAWFADQLATTQAAGIPLYRSLGMLAKMRADTPIGRRMAEIQRRIGDGDSLSQAMEAERQTWGPMVCSLVAAGEASGSLDATFRRISTMLATRIGLRRKILGALTYPIAVMVITIVLVAALLLLVVPRFEDIYDSLGSELPAITKVVVGLSGNAPAALAVVLALVAGVIMTLRLSRRNEELGMKVDRIKLRLPLVGRLIAKGVNARVASTISSLISSGVPLLDALEYASDAAASHPHKRSLLEVKRRLADGSTFSAALADESLWPEMMVQLIAVGEEAGSLPSMMERYADQTVIEVDAAATGMTKLIEPLLMVVIGAIVGVFLLALYLPIFNLGSQLR